MSHKLVIKVQGTVVVDETFSSYELADLAARMFSRAIHADIVVEDNDPEWLDWMGLKHTRFDDYREPFDAGVEYIYEHNGVRKCEPLGWG